MKFWLAMTLFLMGGLFLSLLFLNGCTTTYWQHQAKTDQEAIADKAYCEGQGGSAAGPYDLHRQTYLRVYKDCMKGKGYYETKG